MITAPDQLPTSPPEEKPLPLEHTTSFSHRSVSRLKRTSNLVDSLHDQQAENAPTSIKRRRTDPNQLADSTDVWQSKKILQTTPKAEASPVRNECLATPQSLVGDLIPITTIKYTHFEGSPIQAYPLRSSLEINKILDNFKNKYQLLSKEQQESFWVTLFNTDAMLARFIINRFDELRQYFSVHMGDVYHTLLQQQSDAELPKVTIIPDDSPVNFIWIGSLLPDKYLQNIVETAQCTPKREIIIWKDRTLLSDQDERSMNRLKEHTLLQDVNVKVLDVNDIDFNALLPNSCSEFKNAYNWTTKEYKEYAAACDLLRYALLAMGSSSINSASKNPTTRESSSMIYMDTDRGPKGKKDASWGTLKTPAGFSYPGNFWGNDCLAAAYAKHPVFIKCTEVVLKNLDTHEKRNHLIAMKENEQRQCINNSILGNYGPEVLYKATLDTFGTYQKIPNLNLFPLLKNLFPLLNKTLPGTSLSTPAFGPETSDMSWTELERLDIVKEKPDLSATWINQLPKHKNKTCTIL